MKTTKEAILITSLTLFAERGFDAVSTSMIAERLGITKGALYRHFENKQAIFDSIIEKMYELDAKQAIDNHVPAGEYKDDTESYETTAFADLCEFVNEQYTFWTKNEFACMFRRMITIEQFKDVKMQELYQQVIALGPVQYTQDLFTEMIRTGQVNERARELGARELALMLFAPLQLSIQFYDGGEDDARIREVLRAVTKDFEERWVRK